MMTWASREDHLELHRLRKENLILRAALEDLANAVDMEGGGELGPSVYRAMADATDVLEETK